MYSERDGVNKHPNLTVAEDFVNWKGRVKAYLQTHDYELLSWSGLPESASTAMNRKWQESNVKDKSSIRLKISNGPVSLASKIVDDDKRT